MFYINSMPYLEACIREQMRVDTVVPLGVPHRAMTDTKIGSYDVPEVIKSFIGSIRLNNQRPEHKLIFSSLTWYNLSNRNDNLLRCVTRLWFICRSNKLRLILFRKKRTVLNLISLKVNVQIVQNIFWVQCGVCVQIWQLMFLEAYIHATVKYKWKQLIATSLYFTGKINWL